MGIAATITDMCTGHPPWPPRNCIGPGVPTVLVGGRPASVMGDMYNVHCAMLGMTLECHVGSVVMGSGTVFIGGRPAARIGDQIAGGLCVSKIMGPGVPTVIIGG